MPEQTRRLSADEERIVDELYRRKETHKATHAYVTTTRELEMRVWNKTHPVDENTSTHTVPAGSTLKIVMISTFGDGDFGLTDDLDAQNGYRLRLALNDAAITNIRWTREAAEHEHS